MSRGLIIMAPPATPTEEVTESIRGHPKTLLVEM
jgi:hypothetical protein